MFYQGIQLIFKAITNYIMKSKVTLLIFISMSLDAFAQITFEKGYFIDKQNKRVECLIKNMDWKENPKEFDYKLTENDLVSRGDLSSVKEFGVNGYSRFVHADVKIDVSPLLTMDLSKQRDPEWDQQQLFLKVLVQGKATLYYYEGNGLIRFFYSVNDSSIMQLVYKEYLVDESQVSENMKFRQQLWSDVKCLQTNTAALEQIIYRKTDLVSYFKKYNDCNGSTQLEYGKKAKMDAFNLRIAAGINYASVSFVNIISLASNVDFNKNISFSGALDAEFIMPFNKNKWGFILVPGYQYFNSSRHVGNRDVSINYQSIEFPVGIRYYAFLNPKVKLFFNAMFIPMFSFDFGSTIDHFEVKTLNSYAVGTGVSFNKLSAEVRYYTNRELLYNYTFLYADYSRISAVFGYKIF